ncbi:MAG: ParA family protein [Planctomycetes bacterium]|nr:ParA family protein [Planctomycetota bacterium]
MFEQALQLAVEKARSVPPGVVDELTLVRDLRGRIRLLLNRKRTDYPSDALNELDNLAEELSTSLGNYAFPPDRMLLFAGDLMQGPEIASSPDRLLLAAEGPVKLYLLDRQITGQDWLRDRLPRTTKNPRVTFFGIKGGVGRSTALVIWAWHLARQGKRVLIFDLDLESPGVSSTLLPSDSLPDFGIVDWFVEAGVGQAEAVEREMVAPSPLSKGQAGDIRVVPAFGRKTGDYLPKLARCYIDAPEGEMNSWSSRLESLVSRIETLEKPDVAIIDSRAGIHDIAAVAITRLDAQSLLFAVDSPQTWNAYGFLFHHWRQHPALASVRERLQVVASMIPETNREDHLKRFREHAWDVFRECLYEEAAPDATEAFNFDLNDEEAPHYPWPYFWNRALQEFNPADSQMGMDETTTGEAAGLFVSRADRLVIADEE